MAALGAPSAARVTSTILGDDGAPFCCCAPEVIRYRLAESDVMTTMLLSREDEAGDGLLSGGASETMHSTRSTAQDHVRCMAQPSGSDANASMQSLWATSSCRWLPCRWTTTQADSTAVAGCKGQHAMDSGGMVQCCFAIARSKDRVPHFFGVVRFNRPSAILLLHSSMQRSG